ncbi:MAG: hypothetical protein Q9164_006934, partial [Protoblastenia rupestris]
MRVVEQIPRAPTPPPAWVPRAEPKIVESVPRRERGRSTNKEEAKRRRKRRPRQVIIHQASDEEEDTPSPPEPTRVHERPQRS